MHPAVNMDVVVAVHAEFWAHAVSRYPCPDSLYLLSGEAFQQLLFSL